MPRTDITVPWPRSALRRSAGLLILAGLITLASRADGFGEKLPPDPVEEFQKGLQLEKADTLVEKGDALDQRLLGKAQANALAFRKMNLQKVANKLKSLNQIAEVLLLPTWPIEDVFDYDKKARDIDNAIREELTRRFMSGARDALRSGDPTRQAAVAILVGETALASATDIAPEQADGRGRPRDKDPRRKAIESSRENLFMELSKLAPDVARLVHSPNAQTRGAAARALGQLPRRPYLATAALERIIVGDKAHVLNRRVASASLLSLVQTVTGTEPLLASEPGVMSRETRRNKRLFKDSDRIAVWAAAIPVAARSLYDPDFRVRRNGASALNQATAALAMEIYFAARDPSFKDYPPRDRKELAEPEKTRIREGHKKIERLEELLKPAIAALTTRGPGRCYVPGVLVDAAADLDVDVRLNVRNTFHEMARARRFLLDLRSILPDVGPAPKKGKEDLEKLDPPKDDKEKDKEKDVKTDNLSRQRREPGLLQVSSAEPVAPPVLRLPPPTPRQTVQARDDKKAEKLDLPKNDDKPKGDDKLKNDEPDLKEDEDPNPYKDVKVDRDALGKTLVQIGEQVVRRGTTDTNPAGRRVALEGVEALGELGIAFVPQLVRALEDQDRFVCWIAARTLGKLAPTCVKSPGCASKVVPALLKLIDFVDLDVRIAAIEAIGLYNSSAACAVPALACHLNRGDTEARIALLQALEKIGVAAAPALPEVRTLLRAQDPRLRAEAARLMGLFGPLASSYLPDLRRLLQDPDSEVRRSASSAIIHITDR
jgi:HEAT repeat protein